MVESSFITHPKIVMTRKVPEQAIALIQDQCELRIWEEEQVVPRRWLLDHIADAQGLYCLLTDTVDADLLERAPRLQVVSTMAVGFDNINVFECTERGIPVGNTPGVLTETTADFAFALMMAAARRVMEGVDYVKQGQWHTWSPTLFLGPDLHGATIGIIGTGRIGQAMAKRASGFDMEVLACGSSRNQSNRNPLGQKVKSVDFQTLLTQSDFVSLHVPLTNETSQMIGERELKMMKHTAVLINTARGGVVDSQALYQALVRGDIAYAALDVTDPEPISLEDPLLTLQNCLIVPHMASASVATRNKMATMAAENLLAGLKGYRLPYCVNPEVYG